MYVGQKLTFVSFFYVFFCTFPLWGELKLMILGIGGDLDLWRLKIMILVKELELLIWKIWLKLMI